MSHCITFADIDDAEERIKWALVHCNTFTHRTITDVSDASLTTDTIYQFYFDDEKDAMWFRLYWQ